MSSSNPKAGANPYGRFIPREELQGFASWKPGAFGGAAPAGAAAAEAPEQQALLHAARQVGYQEGYRDGLVALEGFKQTFAHQTTLQVGALLKALGEQLDGLQRQMAQTLCTSATRIARQAVRSAHSPMPMMASVSSASGMNSAGEIMPRLGCCQRISASAPQIRPSCSDVCN